MRSERCKVVVKCRPTQPSQSEALDDEIRLPGAGKIVLGKDFDVDHVYLPKDRDAVYEDEVQALVGSLYEGINSTVFAYGASGSGKTHTVLGCRKNQNPGLIDRITDEVFGSRYNPQTCAVSVSVEELYCERFTDLLAASARPPAHPPHSSSSGGTSSHSHLFGSRGVHLRHTISHRHAAAPVKYNEQKVTITSGEDMKELVQHVLLKRQTAATCINERSSRSHVIVTIELEQRRAITERKFADDEEPGCSSAGSMVSSCAPSVSAGSMADLSSLKQQDSVDARSDAGSEAGSVAPAVTTYLIGKLYLVDLAGSENIKRSGAEGARQKEAGEINKSLCHLKTVIEQVFNGRKAVTYRNSKLTFRLQDALGGGNSKLLVIACISTAKSDLSETKETLRFAEMARAIKNSPMVNREPKDELIHRLELQVAELQDQLRRAQGEGDPGDVLAQLCNTETELCKAEAELAGLKEEMAAQDAKWAQRAVAAKAQFDSLHAMLSASQASEASLQQQLAAEQATAQHLDLQLAAEKSMRQGSQQAGMAAAGLLLEVQGSVSALQEHCSMLQQQVSQQQTAAADAVKLCVQQEQRLQQQLDMQAQEVARLKQQLQQESNARAAAEAQVLQLQRQQEAMQQAAQQCAAEASQGMQHMALLCSTLHEQASAAAAQHHLALQQHNAVASSMQASAAAQSATKRELAAVKLEVSGQRHHCSELQQQLQQQQEEHEAVLTASAAAAAKAAAQAATAQLKQRQAYEAQLKAAQDSLAKLQAQLEDERSEHEAMMRAEQLRHSQELAESMHSSVKKLTADKLRCREHLSMQMHSLKAEVQIFSQALASPTPCLADLPESRACSPASPVGSHEGSGSGRSSPAREPQDRQDEDLAPALRPSKRVSPVPPLQLDPSAAALSDATAAPMQDASERNLSGSETGSSTGSSAATTPGSPPLQAASKTAALVAVAAAAAAMTAQRLTPRKASVHVYAEAGSQGGYADSMLSRGDSIAASDAGRDSPADRMMLPAAASISASPSLSSMDGSQHSMIHPAAAAAASAAAAAVAARVRTSQEQQRRHRRRRREYAKSFTSGSWPISYKPKDAVDMVAAAAAFNKLRGGVLNVENLARFLEHRMLGSKLHSKTLAEGGKKRKHELVQDMLAYYNYYLANNSDSGGLSNPTSSNRAPSFIGAAASATPRSSQCSSPESALWDPLQARPASAVPSSATSSPARLDFLRYSHDGSPAQGTATRSSGGGWGSGGGSKAGSLEAHLQSKAVFAVEAADANSFRQQPDVAAPEQQQQQSGRWSWLTPRRRKQQSILAQLHMGSSKTPDKSPAPGASTAAHHSSEQPQLSVRVPRDESEGGCDAKSPRDKKHAAAASRAGSFSQPSSPGGINLSGKTISAVTGSAVAEFYVDSPSVKLGRSGASKQRGSKGSDPMRLTVDLGGAHRSSWRQVQLLGTK